MKRRILALVLALLLCAAFPICASADAYIPPAYSPPYDITSAHWDNGTCSALNTFLSNFVEVNLQDYTAASDDSVTIAAVLKHLELNAASFSSDVKKVTQEDGSVYMRITKSVFERRMERLFGKEIPASACPGYEDGSILVSADHFGGPIQVFASVYECNEYGDDLYQVFFDAYYVNEDFSGWYRTAHDNLPQGKITEIGSGVALVRYDGGETVDSIATSDFSLEEFTLNADHVPCGGANLPLGYEPPAPTTELPKIEVTEAPVEEATETPTQEAPTTAPALTEAPELPAETISEKELEEEEPAAFSLRLLIIIVAIVLVVAVAALVVILLVFRKRK